MRVVDLEAHKTYIESGGSFKAQLVSLLTSEPYFTKPFHRLDPGDESPEQHH